MAYTICMKTISRLTSRIPHVPALLVLNAVLLILLVTAILATPAPGFQTSFGGATVDIQADRAWVLFPRQCVNITWQLEGIKSLYIDENEKSDSGEMAFCPTLNATSLNIVFTAVTGETRVYDLNIQDLVAATATCLAILALLLPLLIACYYVATMRLIAPLPVNLPLILGLLALLLVFLLIQTAHPFTIDDFLNNLGNVYASSHWQAFGWISAGIIFIPLALQSFRHGLRKGLREDFVVIAAFFVLILLLYSPFGFDFIWQYEEWANQAFLEGRPSKVAGEVLTRYWLLFLYPLANVTGANPIVFHHLLHVAMATCKLVLLYSIVRKFDVAPLYSFLFTTLVMVYPVNSHLLSSQSLIHAFAMSAFLAAVFLSLLFMERPSRLRILGIYLALFFNVGTYENAYAVIALVPILWCWRRPRWTWRNVNLTAIWYLVPAAKLIYLFILDNSNLKFYGAQLISAAQRQEQTVLETISLYAGVVRNVYLQAFARGWDEAFASMYHNKWTMPTLVTLLLAGVLAVYLWRTSKASGFPSRRQMLLLLLGGLFFILPSIAVLMLFERYHNEFWRLYIYVPIGAAAVVISILLLLVSPIKNFRLRQAIFVGLILLLMIPAVSRLFVQHANFVKSANSKAAILRQITEQAPYFDPNASLMLVTGMSLESLERRGIFELWTSMLDSSIFILYQEARPKVAFLCIFGERCSTNDINVEKNFLQEVTDFSEIVIFRLNEDHSVELLHELPSEIGGTQNRTYNPTHLIDTSASIPTRVQIILD